MAPESTALVEKVDGGSPYQLDKNQTLKACNALLKHIKSSEETKEANLETHDLLATESTDTSSTAGAQSIWLILTTKKHIISQKRLKPGKISLPHSLTSPDLSICLITPDPQRQFKDAVVHPSFPTSLSKRIHRVISVKKLEQKYKSYESKRQLRDTHDIFLADARIVTYLPKILGKTFYSTTSKRPIPVELQASNPKSEKKNAALPSTKPRKEPTDLKSITTPPLIAKEIERTLSMAMVSLTPSITTAVRVGFGSFKPEQISENVQAVVAGLLEKYVSKGWKSVRAMHIKGPNTMALPIWLAVELWDDESMVLEDEEAAEAKAKAAQKGKRKRKLMGGGEGEGAENGEDTGREKRKLEDGGEDKKEKKRKLEDADFSMEMKERREKLRQQKRKVREKLEETNENTASTSEALDREELPKKKK